MASQKPTFVQLHPEVLEAPIPAGATSLQDRLHCSLNRTVTAIACHSISGHYVTDGLTTSLEEIALYELTPLSRPGCSRFSLKSRVEVHAT